MATGSRLNISISEDTMQKLDKISQEMGISRSAVITVLIREKWKEEHSDKQ